jgi:hypothetical protein
VSEADSPWARLACRVVRVAMARKEHTYSSLVQLLASDGVDETERSLVLRINRGSLRLSSLLHILSLMSATIPELWRQSLSPATDWPTSAREVILIELREGGITDLAVLTDQLGRLGTAITEQTLQSHIMTGTTPLSLALQLFFIVRSHSLERYVDFSDILKTADKALTDRAIV